jgi:predicted HAD superfamily phosphohydrolase
MKYLNGFHEFVNALVEHKIPLVINSTGYSVTIYSIRAQIGADKIHGHIGNFLRFGINADFNQTLSEDELKRKVRDYFANPESSNDTIYDEIQATGVIDLGIANEEAKAKLIQEYAKKYFKDVQPNAIAHMGDTMGDSSGIVGIAKVGGIGIAFNYNDALKEFLENAIRSKSTTGKIYFIDRKSESSNLARVLPILIQE